MKTEKENPPYLPKVAYVRLHTAGKTAKDYQQELKGKEKEIGRRYGKEALQEQMGGIAEGSAAETAGSRKAAADSEKQAANDKPA